MRNILLLDPFDRIWNGQDPFSAAFSLEGEVFRNVKNRRTLRFFVEGNAYFIKIHRACGWGEILKNLLMFKKPVCGARNEYRAIGLLEKLKIPTMTVCAFGERGVSPAARESFLVTREISGMTTLEDFCADWKTTPPDFGLKCGIIRKLAETAGKMHASGLNHRDCYLCHFLLDAAKLANREIQLTVLDLHRAEIRKRIPERMRVKDLAGLLFSAMDAGISRRDVLRFAAVYSSFCGTDGNLLQKVFRTAEKLYRKEWGRNPPVPV